jgi:hypothetical protein
MNGVDEKALSQARVQMKAALHNAGCPVKLEGDVFIFPFADLRGRFDIVEVQTKKGTAHLHFTLISPTVLATPLCDCWSCFEDASASAIERGIEEWIMGAYGPLHDAFAHQGPKPTCFWPDSGEPSWAVFASGIAKGPRETAPLFALDGPKLRALLATGLTERLDQNFSHRLRYTLVMIDEEIASISAYVDETKEPHTMQWLKEQTWPKVQFAVSRCHLILRPVTKPAPGPLQPRATDIELFREAISAGDHRAARGYLTRALELEPTNPALLGAIAEYAAAAPRCEASPSVEGAAAATLFLEAERALRQDELSQAAQFGLAALSVREGAALEKQLLDYLSVERLARAEVAELEPALEWEHELVVELLHRARKAHPSSTALKLHHAEYLRRLNTPETMALASGLWREIAEAPDAPVGLLRAVMRPALERCDWEEAARICDRSTAPELTPIKLFLEARVDADPSAEEDLAAYVREHPGDEEAKSALGNTWLFEHALPALPQLVPDGAPDRHDPRKPRKKVSFQLWTYERASFFGKIMGALDDRARIVAPVPSDRSREMVRAIAATAYTRVGWSENANLAISGANGVEPRELAAVMAHLPERPEAFEPEEWRFRVQVAAAFLLARAAGKEWSESEAGRLLLDIYEGPLDSATTAVMVATLDLALREPATKEKLREKLEAELAEDARGGGSLWTMYLTLPAYRVLRRLYPEENTYREWLLRFERAAAKL